MLISNGQDLLAKWQRSGISKLSVLVKVYWLNGKDLWRLPKTIKPNVYTCLKWFWNNKDSVKLDYLETKIKTR